MDQDVLALGFDFGLRRIGVAVGGSATGRAEPLTTITCRLNQPDWEKLDQLMDEWKPALLVVGLPYNTDGSESEMTRAARKFAGRIQNRYRIPAELTDERLSSVEAEDKLREQRRSGARRRRVKKEDVDRGAAAVILQSWLDNRK
ncbi:MAG: Holliday junction resolvase RuvX [Gammaproteobacteria bacterium]